MKETIYSKLIAICFIVSCPLHICNTSITKEMERLFKNLVKHIITNKVIGNVQTIKVLVQCYLRDGVIIMITGVNRNTTVYVMLSLNKYVV